MGVFHCFAVVKNLLMFLFYIIKTSNTQDETEVNMARFIHQAMVRRSVVVKLIETMKERGHRAYNNIDMNEVVAKSVALPEHDVSPEIVRLLPLGDLQDKMDLQKNATPAPTPASVEEACALLEAKKFHAVVNERSREDEVDINDRHNVVLRNHVEH